MRVEITSIDALRARRAAGHDLRDVLVTGLDLTESDVDGLLRTAMDGAVFLGCTLTQTTTRRVEATGALIFPAVPGLPYDVYRTSLYTPAELFDRFDPDRPESYAVTPDAAIYRYSRRISADHDPLYALTERLHDHSIMEVLAETLIGRRAAGAAEPVAVMGGHALTRDSAGYRDAVALGAALAGSGIDFTLLTGGGPGAMEAVPLGFRLTRAGMSIVDALAELAAAPAFAHGDGIDPSAIGRWLAAGLRVGLDADADRLPRTIGIPTWFYGHEPPNPFCERHAKYFANSVREDGLLAVASGGIVYTPGSAGTVQEVFQDYTQNHYASVGPPAPMVFLGRHYWTEEVPAAPLVIQLARGREVEPWILVTDDAAEAVELLERYAKR